jgi:hypothetical protein
MTRQAPNRGDDAAEIPLATRAEMTPALRLQILTTEHWSLLSTRAMSWNEAFSRGAMFLTTLSASVVALAFVAQATSLGDGLVIFAALLLPALIFLGVATFVRLVEINREDTQWVIGMNLLRHAYLMAAPELRDYFVTGWHDDAAGVMATFAARTGKGALAHELVTMPGMLAVVVSVLGAALAGLLADHTSVGTGGAITVGVAAFLLTLAALALYQYGGVVRPRSAHRPRFPAPAVVD